MSDGIKNQNNFLAMNEAQKSMFLQLTQKNRDNSSGRDAFAHAKLEFETKGVLPQWSDDIDTSWRLLFCWMLATNGYDSASPGEPATNR